MNHLLVPKTKEFICGKTILCIRKYPNSSRVLIVPCVQKIPLFPLLAVHELRSPLTHITAIRWYLILLPSLWRFKLLFFGTCFDIKTLKRRNTFRTTKNCLNVWSSIRIGRYLFNFCEIRTLPFYWICRGIL